jgi:hypothetical protein
MRSAALGSSGTEIKTGHLLVAHPDKCQPGAHFAKAE